MKVDLTKVKTKGIDGKIFKHKKGDETYKAVAQLLYLKVRDLDLVDIAMQMNRGQVVEMTPTQTQEMRTLIADPNNGFFSFAKKAIFDYLDKIEADKKKKDK